MTDYVKTVNFTAKDSLPSGDPNKVVRGAEIDTEFANIAIAVATKLDTAAAVTASSTTTFTNKTINLANNTVTGTLAEFSTAVSDADLVGVASTQTLTNKTLTDPTIVGTIIEDVFTITDGAAFEIDPANGSIQSITLGANRTPKATNMVSGESVLLLVDDGSAFTITWTDTTFGTGGVVWKTDGGSAPTLNTSGFTLIVLTKVGTQVYGARVGNA